jgi:hypothetical protein
MAWPFFKQISGRWEISYETVLAAGQTAGNNTWPKVISFRDLSPAPAGIMADNIY